jgi:hypothetical protein
VPYAPSSDELSDDRPTGKESTVGPASLATHTPCCALLLDAATFCWRPWFGAAAAGLLAAGFLLRFLPIVVVAVVRSVLLGGQSRAGLRTLLFVALFPVVNAVASSCLTPLT